MITLDYRDKRPIYEQVVEKISHLIVCGALEADSKMPSVRQMALDLSVNPNTIQRAYTMLEQDGYLYTISGRGNFVASPESWQKGRLDEVYADLRKALLGARLSGLSEDKAHNLVTSVYKEVQSND